MIGLKTIKNIYKFGHDVSPASYFRMLCADYRTPIQYFPYQVTIRCYRQKVKSTFQPFSEAKI